MLEVHSTLHLHFRSVSELKSLDATLYKNLVFVKRYRGDVADLGLTFTLTEDSFGQKNTIELKPNGAHVDVTNANGETLFKLSFLLLHS